MKKMKLLPLFVGMYLVLILISCKDSDSNQDEYYTVAEAQLNIDYSSKYNIGKISWSTQRGYQIGVFPVTTKAESQPTSITAWYAVSSTTATREMDSEDLGITVPDKIKGAFEATKYNNASLWRIDEIELENDYTSNTTVSYYEMELDNIQNTNLEAELFFSYDTGELLFSKEELDDDDNDRDKFVINDQLNDAVQAAVPGAVIIDAEVDDNLIEVDVIITSNGIKKEIELEFTMSYVLVSSETEYLYSALPTKFDIVKTWFTNNPTIAPAPHPTTEVEITEGVQTEDDYQIGTYYYEIEIDDYMVGGLKYEVEFYLSEALEIIAVILNDVKQ